MSTQVELSWPAPRVAVVTVTAPDVMNQCSWQMITELGDQLERARLEGAMVTILASGTPGHWLEHAWLRDLRNMFMGQPTTATSDGWFKCLTELAKTSVVTIAAIAGDTSGGGCELGWACDLRIAEDNVIFSQPEVRIAVGTGIGGTSRLMRLIGRTATSEMVLIGRPMTAQRIYELGGINRVVPVGSALAEAVTIARDIAAQSALAVAGMKKMLIESEDLTLTAAIENDQKIFQSFSGGPEALARMGEVQARFDKGETLKEVYWPDLAKNP